MLCLPSAWRRGGACVALAVAAAVLYSRLALGGHWLSDVIGGICLGLAAVPVLVAASRPAGAADRRAALRVD